MSFIQIPATGVGVKVYFVVMVLSRAGDHVPLKPFDDLDGSGAKNPPTQMASTGSNVGINVGNTLIVIVAILAHWPASGVKV